MLANQIKIRAIKLRKKGFSLQEISQSLNIAKSTASLWLQKIPLSEEAMKKLAWKEILGQSKAVSSKKQIQEKQLQVIQYNAADLIKTINYSPSSAKIFCALLWWCEGNKKDSFVRFTNSDETLIKNFLYVFRQGFSLNEDKFRVLVHVHAYHNDEQQKLFWSKVTKIPLSQFHKSFQKTSTGIRKHDNYQGCIAVTYYDAKIAKELEAIYNAFTLKIGAFVNG